MVMDALSRLRGPLVQDAVPQRAAQAGAEAASADVDGLHQPRHHQGGGEPRPGRAGVLLHRRGGGAHLEPDLLRHHQERRLRAAGPQRQCQHRHGVGVLAACGPRGGRRGAGRRASSSSASPSPRWSPTTRCPAARGCSSSSRRSAAAARSAPIAAGTEALSGAFQQLARHRHGRRFPRARAHLRGGRRRPDHPAAAGRPQPARAHLRVAGAAGPRGAARVRRPRLPSASGARPRSWRPSSRRRWRASSACRRWPTPIFPSCARRWPSRSSTSRSAS